MKKRCASLFSGGGGWEIGAIAAGLLPVFAVELDDAIADVYERNIGAHVVRGPAQDVDIETLKAQVGGIDVLFASPPCQGYSTARSKNLPERADKDVGLCVLGYVRVFEPSYVFIENVPPYQHSKTFKAIVAGLWEMGYWVHSQVVNAADYGVPQTRLRLIMRAVKGAMVMPLPVPVPWVGWYEAIEDLIPSLPETKFAPWQLKRLVAAGQVQGNQLLVPGANQGQAREGNKPSLTVTTEDHGTRAFLLPGGNVGQEWDNGFRSGTKPAYTQTVGANLPKALIVAGTVSRDGQSVASRGADAPMLTVLTGPGQPRAFIVNGTTNDDGETLTSRHSEERLFTVTASQDKRPIRAEASNGRVGVVAMTVRALARFQSFPDWYEFPMKQDRHGNVVEDKALACKIIGNAVPPLLAQRLIECTVTDREAKTC